MPYEGTAAKLNGDGMSQIDVATVPSFTRLWVSEKSSCLATTPSISSPAQERALRLIKRRSEIVASRKSPEV